MILVIRFWLTQSSIGFEKYQLSAAVHSWDSQHAHPTKALVFFWQSRGEETGIPFWWWLNHQPIWKIYELYKFDDFHREVGVNIEHKKYLSCHNLDLWFRTICRVIGKMKAQKEHGIVLEGSLLVFRLCFRGFWSNNGSLLKPNTPLDAEPFCQLGGVFLGGPRVLWSTVYWK